MATNTPKKISTATALLQHIALKVTELPLYGALLKVRQWSASERIKYLTLIEKNTASDDDEIGLLTPQAHIVALSLVDDDKKPLFPAAWQDDGTVVFENPDMVNDLIEHRPLETSEAFVEIAKFNGVHFSNDQDDDQEERAAKN